MSIPAVLRLLLIDDSATDAEATADVLRRGGYTVSAHRVDGADALSQAVESQTWDLAINAAACTGLSLVQTVRILRHAGADTSVIVMAEHYDDAAAVESLQSGAIDFFTAGEPERLLIAVERALALTERQRESSHYKQKLQECEERFVTLLDTSRDAVAYLHEGMHVLANRSYLRLFGLSKSGIEDVPLLDLVAEDGHGRFRNWLNEAGVEGATDPIGVTLLGADGQPFDARIAAARAMVNGESCLQLTVYSSEATTDGYSLTPYVATDTLTGVYNSAYFLDQLDKAVTLARTSGDQGALAYIELDRFQSVKEDVGIAGSDQVLRQVADLLVEIIGGRGTLARLSSDVFTWLVTGRDVEAVTTVTEEIRRRLEETIFTAGEQSATLTASMGIASITDQTPNCQTALSQADTACAVARNEDGNKIHRFQRTADKSIGHEIDQHWVERVETALAQDQFRLVFMPIVSLHAEPGERYEVLLRMHGGEEDVLPGQFLNAAEKAGLTPQIDRWVIQQTVNRLAQQLNSGKHTIFFIKLSTPALKDNTFLSWLRTLLDAAQVPADGLVFEMNEMEMLPWLREAKRVIEGLRQLGCGTALEHFGIQDDTFRSLKHLNVDYLKIDGSLITDLAGDQQRRDAVRNIAERARGLGKQTIAEYVQDANSLALLWQDGVNYIQGYYLQRPGQELRYDFAAGT